MGAFGGVEGALEEGAEDGGFDVGPVVLGGGVEDAEVGEVEFDGGGIGEEAAVEVGDVVGAEEAALVAHGVEEDGERAVEADGRVPVVGDEAAKGVAGEEADGVREEAEDEAHEEVRDAFFWGSGGGGPFEFEFAGRGGGSRGRRPR